MQPLTYQIGTSTCWATSIINGIMFLRGGERIESHKYKVLHSALNSILRRNGVLYYYNVDFGKYQAVAHILETCFSLKFNTVRGDHVADTIRKLHFNDQVAICDVGDGDHSILLNGKRKN